MSYRVKAAVCAVFLGLLAGCNPPGSVPAQTDTISASPKPTDNIWITTGTYTETTPEPVNTASTTPIPTILDIGTVAPTPYPTMFPPGFIPTPRPTPTTGLPATATIAPAETCPAPTHKSMEIRLLDHPLDYEQPILDYLTANGEIQEYVTKLETIDKELHQSDVPTQIHMEIIEEDVTGDGIDEFLIGIDGNGRFDILEELDPERPVLFVVGCRGGAYAVIHRVRTYSTIRVDSVMDLNADGIHEIAYSYINNFGANHGYFTFQLQVLEWNGAIFRELLWDPYTDATTPGTTAFEDVDGNGTLEILFPHDYWGEKGGGVDCDIGPNLNSKDIWMWNGEYYHYMWRQNADPIYRFQAAYDGDYYISLGLYDRSEKMYLRAAFDESLKSGSTGDWMRDGECYGGKEIKPDPTEPPRIRAYARFRLVELYVNLGRVLEAESHRSSMRTENPLGSPGYIYAYLANTFWWEYVKDEDVTAACAAVRSEAEKRSTDVFGLFENYGILNPGPTLDTICPFST
jgi:hypothetical protein